MLEIIKILYKNNMFQVFLNNEEYFNIPLELYSSYKLEKGNQLDKVAYQQLKEESERFMCYQKALAYLAIRSRSAREVATYLRKKNFSDYLIQETISRLRTNNYISDYDFAVDYIKNKSSNKAIGQQYLKSKLYEKGIARQIVAKALKVTGADQVDIHDVYELAKKKFLQVKNKTHGPRKIQLFLAGRGFDWDIIRRVMDLLKEEFDQFHDDNDFYSE